MNFYKKFMQSLFFGLTTQVSAGRVRFSGVPLYIGEHDMNTTFKNIAALTLCAVAALAVACDSPLSQEDSNKQIAEMSVLAIAGGSAITSATSTTTPATSTLTGSCMAAASGSCQDYYNWSSSANAQANCLSVAGTVYTAGVACNASNRVGSCQYPSGYSPYSNSTGHGSGYAVVRFYSSSYSTGSAQTYCNGAYAGTVFSAN